MGANTIVATADQHPDMEDQELAEALAIPSGLKKYGLVAVMDVELTIHSLGNTCYMNATIQALRVIPPMQAALNTTEASGSLIPQLRDLYSSMLKTTDSITPLTFLQALRQALPQFAEQSRGGVGYAQQDAEEAFSQIVNCLRPVTDASDANKRFVEQWMMGEISRETKLEGDASLEPPTFSTEKILKLECHISITTNYMATGIVNSLQTTLTKRSPALGHEASYVQTTRVTRLPSFLTVHMVRFAWRADVGRKAKIMRKVKFPTTYDALEITSDELKARLMPVNRRLVEIDKGRAERRKIRLRKRGLVGGGDTAAMDVDDQGEPEDVIRAKEREEIEGLVDPAIKADIGASWSGLYDLVAIVTHKGAAADSGHYIGFAKKSAFHDPTYLDRKILFLGHLHFANPLIQQTQKWTPRRWILWRQTRIGTSLTTIRCPCSSRKSWVLLTAVARIPLRMSWSIEVVLYRILNVPSCVYIGRVVHSHCRSLELNRDTIYNYSVRPF